MVQVRNCFSVRENGETVHLTSFYEICKKGRINRNEHVAILFNEEKMVYAGDEFFL